MVLGLMDQWCNLHPVWAVNQRLLQCVLCSTEFWHFVCQLLRLFLYGYLQKRFLKQSLNWAVQLYICWRIPQGRKPEKHQAHRRRNYSYSMTRGLLAHYQHKKKSWTSPGPQKPLLCLLLVWMTGTSWHPWDSQALSPCPILLRP